MTQAVMLDASSWSPAQRRASDLGATKAFMVLRGLFAAAEIEEASDEADQLLRPAPQSDFDAQPALPLSAERPHRRVHVRDVRSDHRSIGPACRQLKPFDPQPAVRSLAELYDDEPCLFKDKLIYKPPGVKGYGLHQDWIGWPGFPRSFLTVLLPLDDVDVDNGCTEVFGGYHRPTA